MIVNQDEKDWGQDAENGHMQRLLGGFESTEVERSLGVIPAAI